MLRVEIQRAPSVVTLFCFGRVVLGLESETLRCMAASQVARQIILDLEQVQAIDAAGLGLLVELHCRAQERQGSLTIENASPRVRKIMALTKLDSVVSMAGSTHPLTAEETAGQRAMTA